MDMMSFALGAASAQGGGGNPNSVETITGTLNNPFGSAQKALDTFYALVDRSCSCYLESSGITDNDGLSADLFGVVPLQNDPDFDPNEEDYQTISFQFLTSNSNTVRAATFAYIDYFAPSFNAFHAFSHLDNASTASVIDTSASCTLTIIHHPLPEG